MSSSPAIAKGSQVKFHFTLTVDGGELESSRSCEPLEYEHGKGRIVPGLEEALEGLTVGDKKVVTLPPDKAYGERNPKALQEVPKRVFADADKLSPGDEVAGQSGNNQLRAVVKEVKDEVLVLDFNHPLAGRTLEFDVEIVEVS